MIHSSLQERRGSTYIVGNLQVDLDTQLFWNSLGEHRTTKSHFDDVITLSIVVSPSLTSHVMKLAKEAQHAIPMFNSSLPLHPKKGF